jgi:hypothetical protein
MNKIISILAISSGFQIGLKEAQEKYKRAKSKEGDRQGIPSGYTTQENSPEKDNSPEKLESPNNEKETFIEEVINELEKESIEELEKVIIFCGKYGPYDITGKGENYEIMFDEKERDSIPKKEFIDFCDENDLNAEEILEEIRNYVELMEEKDKKNKGKRSLEQTFRMVEKNIERGLAMQEGNTLRMIVTGDKSDEEILKEFLQWLKSEETNQKENSDEESYDSRTEKVINTPRISQSPEQIQTESEKESITEEESESEESITTGNSNILIMALNIIQVRKFSGENDEDPQEWLNEFVRAAVANQWEPMMMF